MTTALSAPPASRTATDRIRNSILHRYGIEVSDANRRVLDAFVARMHRSRWWGVVGAVIGGGLGWFGSNGGALWVARIFAGYLLGSAIAELLSRGREVSGEVHSASLSTRRPLSLAPWWARVAPWLLLIPCMASPLLIFGEHPTGVTRFGGPRRANFVTAEATWFPTAMLVATAVLAAIGLLVWWLTLSRLCRRTLPFDDADRARLDLLTRLLSARAASGAVVALGLSLVAGLLSVGGQSWRSLTCTSPNACHAVYAYSAHADDVENLGGVFFLAAIMLFAISRWAWVDKSLLGSESTPTP